MRLYTLSKRHFVLVFVVFFICFGLTVFVGIKGESFFSSSFHFQRSWFGAASPAVPSSPSSSQPGLLSEPTGQKVVMPQTLSSLEV